MAIKKGLTLGSVLNKSGKFGRMGARISKQFFSPELGGEAVAPRGEDDIKVTDNYVRTSDFIHNIKGQLARPSLFEVRIKSPSGVFWAQKELGEIEIASRVLSLTCYNAQIPGVSVATTDKDIGYRAVGYQKLYDDVLLSFYCQEKFSELEFMTKWINSICSPISNRLGYYEEYTSTIDIINLARDNTKTLTTTLHEAYPKKVDPMQLDYGSNDIMRMTVNFTYRYFTQVWGNKEKVGESLRVRHPDADTAMMGHWGDH